VIDSFDTPGIPCITVSRKPCLLIRAGMRRTFQCRALLLLAATVCTPALAVDPATELTYAYSTRSCGPIDQPVTMIYLTRDPVTDGQPRPPYVQLWFAQGLDENGRFEGRWNGPQGDVGGTWCSTEQDCNPVKSGKLKIQRSAEDGTLNGEIEFELEGPVRGPLNAEPLPAKHQLCG